jgi:hypothetical protein
VKSPTKIEKGFSSARSDNSKKSQKYNKNGVNNLLKRPAKKSEPVSCKSVQVKMESASLSPVKVLKLDLVPLLRGKDADQAAPCLAPVEAKPQFAFKLLPTD